MLEEEKESNSFIGNSEKLEKNKATKVELQDSCNPFNYTNEKFKIL